MTVEVVVPTELTDEQRAAVESLAEVTERRRASRSEAERGDERDGCRRTRARRTPEAPRRQAEAVYVISVAAELAGVHPQTLRIYERKGLLDPSRTSGGSRRFSERDLARLRRIQELTATGLNLEGVRRVLELEAELAPAARRARRRRGLQAQDGGGGRRTASTGATWCRCARRPVRRLRRAAGLRS